MRPGHRLVTDRLIIRSWEYTELDRTFFHYINSNEDVMHFFPFRRSRQQCDELLMRFIDESPEKRCQWAVACLRSTGEPIGFTGLAEATFDAEFNPSVEIGWRYATHHWGKGYASEAARALLKHGFEDLELDRITSFAVPKNTASTTVMRKIGMLHVPDSDFDHPSVGDDFPHLKRHVFYTLSAELWQAQQIN